MKRGAWRAAIVVLLFSTALPAQARAIIPAPAPTSTAVAAIPTPATAPAPSTAVLAQVPVGVTRLITVVAPGERANRATLTAWTRTPEGRWRADKVVPGRLGARGLAPAAERIQGTLTTPSGSFALGRAFGNARKPAGTSLAYHRVRNADWWVYDPRDASSYNRWVTGRPRNAKWRTSWAEHLVRYRTQYQYALVIDYNFALSPGVPRRTGGGGIFLHVNGSGSTAGCVSVSAASMRWILRWLEPAGGQIVIGTAAALS